jgi:hypothetical protein
MPTLVGDPIVNDLNGHQFLFLGLVRAVHSHWRQFVDQWRVGNRKGTTSVAEPLQFRSSVAAVRAGPAGPGDGGVAAALDQQGPFGKSAVNRRNASLVLSRGGSLKCWATLRGCSFNSSTHAFSPLISSIKAWTEVIDADMIDFFRQIESMCRGDLVPNLHFTQCPLVSNSSRWQLRSNACV